MSGVSILDPQTVRGRLDSESPCWYVIRDGWVHFTVHSHPEPLVKAFAGMIAGQQDWDYVELLQLPRCDHKIPVPAELITMTRLPR